MNILFRFRIFEQLAFALKNRVCREFIVLNMYFLSFRIYEQLALTLKTEFALKIFKPERRQLSRPQPRTPVNVPLPIDKCTPGWEPLVYAIYIGYEI